jgi:hypothetical protein
MSPAILIGELCPYCMKFRNPRDIIHQPGGVRICLDCEQRHLEALDAMASAVFTGACSECGKTSEQLRSPGGQMAVHFEAGRYRMMCLECDRIYVPKRRELYAKTEFGERLKLN